MNRAVVKQPQSHADEATISTFAADPEKLGELLQGWDLQHQTLYGNKREAMLKYEGSADFVPQWPPSEKGNLKEIYLSSLNGVSICYVLSCL